MNSGAVAFQRYYDFVRHDLPKVELHAHLNGCIPLDILHQLADERGVTLPARYFGPPTDRTTTVARVLTDDDRHNCTLPPESPPDMYNRHPRSLQDCFDMFAVLPSVVTDLNALQTITRAALTQFALHHTVYVELRSTPKRLFTQHVSVHASPSIAQPDSIPSMASKLDYIRTVVDEMHAMEQNEQDRYQCECKVWEQRHAPIQPDSPPPSKTSMRRPPRLPMTCRLILSMDRGQSVQEARDTVELAIQIRQGQYDTPNSHNRPLLSSYVVGLDLGGNPTQQSFADFEPLLTWARQQMSDHQRTRTRDHNNESDGNNTPHDTELYMTIHTGEIPCGDVDSASYQEARAVLDFGPNRLGHAVLWPRDLWDELSERHIPVETCPTSNVMTLELHNHTHSSQADHSTGNLVHGLVQHQALAHWMTTQHPVAICTDDPGVFDTDPTQELWLLATAFDVPLERLVSLVVQSMSHAFCSVDTQQQIQDAMRRHVDLVLSHDHGE